VSKYYLDQQYTFYEQVIVNSVTTDLPVPPTYRVYEDSTATPILSGDMILFDSGNTNGFYYKTITLSTANGFGYGSIYCIRKYGVNDAKNIADLETISIATEAEHKTKRMADLVLIATVNSTDFAPTITQFEVDGLSDTTLNAYKDCFIKIESGDNIGEVKQITESKVVVTKVRLTVGQMQAIPANSVTMFVF
jgi:hypothetical protein